MAGSPWSGWPRRSAAAAAREAADIRARLPDVLLLAVAAQRPAGLLAYDPADARHVRSVLALGPRVRLGEASRGCGRSQSRAAGTDLILQRGEFSTVPHPKSSTTAPASARAGEGSRRGTPGPPRSTRRTERPGRGSAAPPSPAGEHLGPARRRNFQSGQPTQQGGGPVAPVVPFALRRMLCQWNGGHRSQPSWTASRSSPAGWGQPRGRPQSSKADQAAVGVILTVSFFASLGSGIFTSTMPSCVLASIFFGSTPAGSVIEREKDP